MSGLPPEALLGLAVLGAVLYTIKRLSAFDLELRAHRERARNQYWREYEQRLKAEALAVQTMARRDGKTMSASEIFFDAEEQVTTRILSGATVFDDERQTWLQWQFRRKRVRLYAKTLKLLAEAAAAEETPLSAKTVANKAPEAALPTWALALLEPDEADRCAREWMAHWYERMTSGECREARVDRSRYVRYVVLLALTRQASRALSRSR